MQQHRAGIDTINVIGHAIDQVLAALVIAKAQLGSLTLIAQYATPIRIAYAFPGTAIAGTMLTARIDHALVAQGATPAGSTSG